MPEETATTAVQYTDKSRAPVIVKNKTRLPKPKQLKYTGKGIEKFFEYWGSFNEEQFGCSEAKIYRKYPVIDQCLIGGKHKERIDLIEGKMPFEPEDYESFFLHNYGGGEYSIVIDEKGVPGIVAACTFKCESQEYPPRVDIKTLVAGHPSNRGFIEGLKARGVKLPWENEPEQEEGTGDMKVATQLIDTVIRTNERLAEKNEELQERVTDAKESAAAPATTAMSESIKLMADTNRLSSGMLVDTLRGIMQASAPNYNPLDVLKTLKELTPQSDNGMAMATLITQVMQQNQNTQAETFNRIIELMKIQQQPQAPQVSEIDSFLNQADKLERLKNVMGWGGSHERSEPPPQKGWVSSMLENPKVAEAIPVLAQAALLVVQNLFGNRASQPVSNPAPQPQTTTAVQPAPAQQPQRQMTPEEQQQADATLQFLHDIEKPLIAHYFGEGLNGYTFAYAIQSGVMDANLTPEQIRGLIQTRGVSAAGQSNYGTLLEWGAQKLDALIRSYGPIWNTIQGAGMKKYHEFLNQFFTYDKWAAEQTKQSNGAAQPQVN